MKFTYSEKILAEIEKSQNKFVQTNKEQATKRPEKQLGSDKLSTNKVARSKIHREIGM